MSNARLLCSSGAIHGMGPSSLPPLRTYGILLYPFSCWCYSSRSDAHAPCRWIADCSCCSLLLFVVELVARMQILCQPTITTCTCCLWLVPPRMCVTYLVRESHLDSFRGYPLIPPLPHSQGTVKELGGHCRYMHCSIRSSSHPQLPSAVSGPLLCSQLLHAAAAVSCRMRKAVQCLLAGLH